jgi:hypothetical protein
MLGLAQGIDKNEAAVPTVDFSGATLRAPAMAPSGAANNNASNGVVVYQTNNNYNPFDYQAATKELAWSLGVK